MSASPKPSRMPKPPFDPQKTYINVRGSTAHLSPTPEDMRPPSPPFQQSTEQAESREFGLSQGNLAPLEKPVPMPTVSQPNEPLLSPLQPAGLQGVNEWPASAPRVPRLRSSRGATISSNPSGLGGPKYPQAPTLQSPFQIWKQNAAPNPTAPLVKPGVTFTTDPPATITRRPSKSAVTETPPRSVVSPHEQPITADIQTLAGQGLQPSTAPPGLPYGAGMAESGNSDGLKRRVSKLGPRTSVLGDYTTVRQHTEGVQIPAPRPRSPTLYVPPGGAAPAAPLRSLGVSYEHNTPATPPRIGITPPPPRETPLGDVAPSAPPFVPPSAPKRSRHTLLNTAVQGLRGRGWKSRKSKHDIDLGDEMPLPPAPTGGGYPEPDRSSFSRVSTAPAPPRSPSRPGSASKLHTTAGTDAFARPQSPLPMGTPVRTSSPRTLRPMTPPSGAWVCLCHIWAIMFGFLAGC
jgi:hypothetical protein